MLEEERIASWKKLKNLVLERDLDALFFSSYPNVFYLSGLKASQAFLVFTKEKAYLITDARYYERAKNLTHPFLEIQLLVNDPFKFLKNFFHTQKLKKIGFEKDRVSCEFVEKLRSKKYRLIGLSQPLKELRMLKTTSERKKIKEAVKITDKIYKDLLSFINGDLMELEIRGKIVELAFKYSAEGEAFPSIVAFSEHSAIPHWESSRTPLGKKGPLLIDMGVIYQGYCSDFTRTLFLGKADKEFRKIYSFVKDAWYKAFEKVKIGVPICELDKVIREYFQEKGVLSNFTHATGHGLGIEIHEYPRIYFSPNKKNSKEEPLIEEGMVFTIEPGLYFPGKFGIRLENVVFVENGEGKIYSEISLDLLEL
ncbi:MAG: M24 family metallopeptidase [Caldimicrobium sp.]